MAVIKFNNRKNSTTGRRINRLKRVVDYITDPYKTDDDLIGGNGVNKENALSRMNTVKNYYNKCGGREYIHFVVSFQGQQDADSVYFIANQIAMLYEDYQVLFAVHLNTANTHIHFVINTVCVSDGHKYSQSKYDMKCLKEQIESIIAQSGLLCTDIYEDNDNFDWEDEDYDEDAELVEPMIFFDEPHLIKPMIFFDE